MNQTSHRSWGIRVGGILCLLLNTRREIYGYEVPSKYSMDFLEVLYESKMHVKNWKASSYGRFFFSKHPPLIIIFLVISNGYHGKKWIIQLVNLFYAFKMPISCLFWAISSEYHKEKTNRNFWPFFMLDNAPLQRHYSTQSAPISSQACSFFQVNLKLIRKTSWFVVIKELILSVYQCWSDMWKILNMNPNSS